MIICEFRCLFYFLQQIRAFVAELFNNITGIKQMIGLFINIKCTLYSNLVYSLYEKVVDLKLIRPT